MRHGRDRVPSIEVEAARLEEAALVLPRVDPRTRHDCIVRGRHRRRPFALLATVLLALALALLVAVGPAAAADEEGGADPASELVQENPASASAVENESDAAQTADQAIAGDAGTDPTGGEGDAATDPAGDTASDPGTGDPAQEGEPVDGAGAPTAEPEQPETPMQSQISDAEVTANQQAGADAEAIQEDPTNTNVTVAVGQAGDHPAVDQGNHASAGAQAGTDASLPASASQGNQNASANASTSQTNPTNTNVTVLVDSPGDTGPVSQANSATATAGAAADANLPDAAQSGQAQAAAAQDGASNTNVAVRVDSPGDNGAITQQNSADADASATTSSADGDASAAAQASQNGARNTNVSIRIDSPGESGAVAQGNSSQETTLEESGDAVDETVSIQATGSNVDAELDVTSGSPITVPSNWTWTWTWVLDGGEAVDWDAIVADIESSLRSGDWDWVWGDDAGSQDAGSSTAVDDTAAVAEDTTPTADDATTDDSAAGDATVAADDPSADDATASDDAVADESASQPEGQNAGRWTWNWVWNSDVDGWNWLWEWIADAPCDSCTWTWDWNWTWTNTDGTAEGDPAPAATADEGAGAPDGSDTAPPADAVEQTNAADAQASAETDASVDQAVAQDQEGESDQTQQALQSTTVDQSTAAAATATQEDASNLTTTLPNLASPLAGGAYGSVSQTNQVEAVSDAAATSESFQGIGQAQGGDGSEQSQWAGQVVEVDQDAAALSLAEQEDVWNENSSAGSHVAQLNLAGATATTSVESDLTQLIAQGQGGDDSVQSQQGGQIASVLESHSALAVASQGDAGNSNLSTGGAFSQENASLAAADSQAKSTGLQAIAQAAAGDGQADAQESWQVLTVVQEGVASATASQSHVVNENVSFAPAEDEPVLPARPRRDTSSTGHPVSSASPFAALPPAPAQEPPVQPAPVLEAAAEPPTSAYLAESSLHGLPPHGDVLSVVSLELVPEQAGIAGGSYQVSASHAGERRASATRTRSTGDHAVVDAVPGEALLPLPGPAPSESGATAGSLRSSSSSGPSATVARLALASASFSFRPLSSTVRRSAVFLRPGERPG